MWVSSVATVRFDPLGYSHVRSRGARVSRSDSERGRRVAAWIYRWYDPPTLQDWETSCAWFGLSAVPRHTLVGEDGCGEVTITIAGGQLTVNKGGSAAVAYQGRIKLGCLAPDRLLKFSN